MNIHFHALSPKREVKNRSSNYLCKLAVFTLAFITHGFTAHISDHVESDHKAASLLKYEPSRSGASAPLFLPKEEDVRLWKEKRSIPVSVDLSADDDTCPCLTHVVTHKEDRHDDLSLFVIVNEMLETFQNQAFADVHAYPAVLDTFSMILSKYLQKKDKLPFEGAWFHQLESVFADMDTLMALLRVSRLGVDSYLGFESGLSKRRVVADYFGVETAEFQMIKFLYRTRVFPAYVDYLQTHQDGYEAYVKREVHRVFYFDETRDRSYITKDDARFVLDLRELCCEFPWFQAYEVRAATFLKKQSRRKKRSLSDSSVNSPDRSHLDSPLNDESPRSLSQSRSRSQSQSLVSSMDLAPPISSMFVGATESTPAKTTVKKKRVGKRRQQNLRKRYTNSGPGSSLISSKHNHLS